MEKKYVYLFTEGNADMRELLGGKGANLAEMTRIGLPVPQGFTISTEACTRYYDDGKVIAPDIEKQIYDALAKTEEIVGKKFGDREQSLAGFRPFRCPRLHARHDGHHPEPGPERHRRQGPGQADQQRALCL